MHRLLQITEASNGRSDSKMIAVPLTGVGERRFV
jgi:hypothetical protein